MTENREQWSRTIWNKLRSDNADITREPLPRRWVDLIHHLDEQERERSEDQRSETISPSQVKLHVERDL